MGLSGRQRGRDAYPGPFFLCETDFFCVHDM